MGAERLELSRPCGQRILSPLRLPFRHAPVVWLPLKDAAAAIALLNCIIS